MGNPFDQYTQPENRLTHALACTLEADRNLIRPFLARAGIGEVPPESILQITQQQVPGVPASGEETEGERRGVPDACIYAPDGWAVLIEAKVQAGVSADQLRRHAAFARRCGLHRVSVVVLSVDSPHPSVRPESLETPTPAWIAQSPIIAAAMPCAMLAPRHARFNNGRHPADDQRCDGQQRSIALDRERGRRGMI